MLAQGTTDGLILQENYAYLARKSKIKPKKNRLAKDHTESTSPNLVLDELGYVPFSKAGVFFTGHPSSLPKAPAL